MKKYIVKLSFEEEIEAKNQDDAMEQFLEIIDSMAGGWEEDFTEIKELVK